MIVSIQRPSTLDGEWFDAGVFSFDFRLVEKRLKPSELESLSAYENVQLERMGSKKRQAQFIAGRVSAKQAIYSYLKSSFQVSQDIRPYLSIEHGVFGHPIVCYDIGDDTRDINDYAWRDAFFKHPLDVSISHTTSCVGALAFQQKHPMAIDIECFDKHRHNTMLLKMSNRECDICLKNAHECPDLASVKGLVTWTAKESLSKVLKTGLSLPLEFYELSEIKPYSMSEHPWVLKFAQLFDRMGMVKEPRMMAYDCRYSNFKQYKSLVFILGDSLAISLCLPRNSQLIACD